MTAKRKRNAEILAMHRGGRPVWMIARDYGISKTRVYQLLPQRRPLDFTTLPHAKAVLSAGGSLGEAAAAIGCKSSELDIALWRSIGRAK